MSGPVRISGGGWPWGRTAPARRLRDLKAAREAQLGRKKIIDDQAREAHRRVDLMIVEIERQIELAQKCLEIDLRAQNKRIAYQLQAHGIEMIERVDAAEDQEAVAAELREILDRIDLEQMRPGADSDEWGHSAGPQQASPAPAEEGAERKAGDLVSAMTADDFFRSE